MKRLVQLGLAAAAVVAFALPAQAEVDYCDATFRPACKQCVTIATTIGPRCVNLELVPAS